MGRKLGALPILAEGRWVPIYHNVARAEAYPHAKFHIDPSNRLATVHQCHRQDRQTNNGLIAQGKPFYKRLLRKYRQEYNGTFSGWQFSPFFAQPYIDKM